MQKGFLNDAGKDSGLRSLYVR